MNWQLKRDSKADVSSVSPSSERVHTVLGNSIQFVTRKGQQATLGLSDGSQTHDVINHGHMFLPLSTSP